MPQTITQNLTPHETETMIHLIKRAKLKYLPVYYKDIKKLVPDSEKIEKLLEGVLNLNTRELHLKFKDGFYARIDWLVEKPVMSETYVYDWWYQMLNNLNITLGFDRLMELFSELLQEKFEALSAGQADALLKKLFHRARHDGQTLSSTTRSQIQQIRDKIRKYQPLVEFLGPLFINKEISITNKIGPEIGWDAISQPSKSSLLDEIQYKRQNLVKTPPKLEDLDEKEIEKIEKIKEAAISKGLYNVVELGPETYYFFCRFCDYKKELDPSKSIEEQHESHHGSPLALRPTRTDTSDY